MDDYAITSVSNIIAPEGFHPKDILSSSKTLILFAKLMPQFIFDLDSKVKSFYLHRLVEDMDKISFEISKKLISEGYKSIPITTFFPARVSGGKINGILSLKHCAVQAGMGSLGQNTLLISEKHGNALCLSAILTEKELNSTNNQNNKELCLKCNKCIKICPTHAISDDGVEVTKCINFMNPIPKLFRPIIGKIIKSDMFRKYSEIFVNTISWNVDMECSKCLTICPCFKKENFANK